MRMINVILILVTSLFLTNAAQATVTLYQAAGVLQYQQNGQQMRAQNFDVGNLLSLSACNSAIANHNHLLSDGSVTPGNSQNSRTKLDAICHAVMPPQLPGWFGLGQAQVQQSNQPSQPLQVKIGPFATYDLCKAAFNRQKTLTLQNTPITDNNVAYKLDGDCYKLMD